MIGRIENKKNKLVENMTPLYKLVRNNIIKNTMMIDEIFLSNLRSFKYK